MAEIARNWLVTVSRRRSIPHTAAILDSYDRFFEGLPAIAVTAGTTVESMLYADFERLVLAWVGAERAAAKAAEVR